MLSSPALVLAQPDLGGIILVQNRGGQRGGRVLLLAGGWTPLVEWSDPADDFAEILAIAEPERFAP